MECNEKSVEVGKPRFGLEFGYAKPPCGSGDPKPPDWWYSLIDNLHYLHFGFILWMITGIVTWVALLIAFRNSTTLLYVM